MKMVFETQKSAYIGDSEPLDLSSCLSSHHCEHCSLLYLIGAQRERQWTGYVNLWVWPDTMMGLLWYLRWELQEVGAFLSNRYYISVILRCRFLCGESVFFWCFPEQMINIRGWAVNWGEHCGWFCLIWTPGKGTICLLITHLYPIQEASKAF